MASDLKIQKRLKSLVKIKNPKTIDEFSDALTDLAKYLSNIVNEAVFNLGVSKETFAIETIEREAEFRPMKCNGCGSSHGGSCILSKHPNYNSNHETISWKDSDPGKALLDLGFRNLPWDKQMVKNKSTGVNELVPWTNAPPKPIRNKEGKKFKKT